MINPVKVKCKKCGRDVKSDMFVLDPVFKMMVCPDCVKERKMQAFTAARTKAKEQAQVAIEVEKKSRPAGWDGDDEEVSRSYANKQSKTVHVEKIDDVKVRYTCPKCKYTFVIDTVKCMPARCSYCGTAVQNFTE